jgi:hypothetical protein
LTLLLIVLAAGKVSGTIAYAGRPVHAPRVARTDAACPKELRDAPVTLSKSGKALANVLVRVVSGAPAASEVPAEPVVITQRDCMYEPRVQGAVKGQRLVVKNADGTVHNVHAFAGLDEKKTLFNLTQPAGAKDVERDVKDTLGLVRLTCDVHPWMRGSVLFSENAYFTVSDAEGAWALELPAGEYTLEAWHETLGTQTADVKVEDGKVAEVRLAFPPAKPAAAR